MSLTAGDTSWQMIMSEDENEAHKWESKIDIIAGIAHLNTKYNIWIHKTDCRIEEIPEKKKHSTCSSHLPPPFMLKCGEDLIMPKHFKTSIDDDITAPLRYATAGIRAMKPPTMIEVCKYADFHKHNRERLELILSQATKDRNHYSKIDFNFIKEHISNYLSEIEKKEAVEGFYY